jgi:hypothetical protein
MALGGLSSHIYNHRYEKDATKSLHRVAVIEEAFHESRCQSGWRADYGVGYVNS